MITDADRALLNELGCDSYSEVRDLALIALYREQAAKEAYALGRIEGAKAMLALMMGSGCPVCNGDCAGAKPPVVCCPMKLDPETITKDKP